MTGTAPLTDTIGLRTETARDAAGAERGADLALVRRCARRDAAALDALVRRHQARLYGFLVRLLDSPEDAEEAVQDVFVRVWQQAGGFEGRASVATWLYRIAANVATDRLRRRKCRPATVSLAEAPALAAGDPEHQALEGLAREERARQLAAALGRLRTDDRLLLTLYYAEELTYEEMCRITGCVAAVLKMRLLRARRRLRAALECGPAEEGEEDR